MWRIPIQAAARSNAMFLLDASLAQSIVDRAMQILHTNVNVMDERGLIIASGERARIGTRHDGALLVLAQQRAVEIDEATGLARTVQPVRRAGRLAQIEPRF